MESKRIAIECLNMMKESGVDKAQCLLKNTEKRELSVNLDKIDLLRSTFDASLQLTAIVGDRKGVVSINKMEMEDVKKGVEQVVEMAQSSEQDSANDISPRQPGKVFQSGPESPDLDLMYDRLDEFMGYAAEAFPKTTFRTVVLNHALTKTHLLNSNGVDFEEHLGEYSFMVLFSSKEGKRTSSFNYSGYTAHNLDKPIKDVGSIDTLLRQSVDQISAQALKQKFVGDVLVTPDCLESFLSTIEGTLRDYALISGGSLFKDKLNQPIADQKLTLHSRPTSKDMSGGYFVTNDGFEAQDNTIIDHGVLKTFLLSLYGANKTGMERAVNNGDAYVVEPGCTRFDDMIKSIDKGVMLCRFSGGSPSDNGDFSGVAKNSYYIENGKIQYPINEVMVSIFLISQKSASTSVFLSCRGCSSEV